MPGSIPVKQIQLEEIHSSTLTVQRVSNDQLIVNMALANDYSQYEANLFLRIARGESTLNERAVGYASTDKLQFLGLFQIAYPLTWNYSGCSGDVFNPVDNINCALKVQKQQGWHAWEVYTKGI